MIVWLCHIIIGTSQSTASIQGIVIDTHSETTLKSVGVKILGTTFFTETTLNGNFKIENIPEGTYVLELYLEGYSEKNISFEIIENQTVDLGTIYFEKTKLDFIDNSIISLTDNDLSDDGDRSPAYVSGVFQSAKDVYLKAAAYNFSQAWFKVRGYDSNNGTILINGIEMNKLYDGRPQWSNWGGLNDVFRNQVFTNGIAPSAYTFGGVLGTTNFSIRASDYQAGGKISLSSTNKSYSGRAMATYATGLTSKNWAFVGSASYRFAQEGHIDGTPYKAWSGFLAIEKKLNSHHSFNLTAFAAYVNRGKSSPNTQEVFDLKGYKYNSYWGNQEGEQRNSRMKEIMEPIIMLTYFYNNLKTTIQTTLSYQFGHTSNSRLGYFNAPNPDPTYWKYLPSSFLQYEDNLDYANAYLTEQEFLENGQLNWQNLYQVNTDKGNSLYYLYEDKVEDSQLSFSSVLNSNLSDNYNLNASISYQNLASENYGNMLDLLGGNGFVDLDPYSQGDARQNDLNNPNRIATVGDKFQYNYNINASVIGAFSQLQYLGNRLDYFVGISFKNTNYQRDGLFKNGRYPDNSLGESAKLSFSDFSAKGGFTYKFSGRHLASLNAGYLSIAPNIRNSFSNARVNNNVTPNLTSENILTTDVSYLYRSPKFQGRITGFYTQFKNAIETGFFFAEGLLGDQADFVNEVVTGIDKQNMGIELSAAYQATSTIGVLFGGSFGQYTYNNNPQVYLESESFTDLNSNFGTAYLDNYFVAGTPQRGYSLGVEYRDPKYWFIQVNGNLLSNNYIDISPILRTDNFYLDADGIPFIDNETGEQVTQEQVNSLLIQEKFNDLFLLNVVGGKSWFLNKRYFGFFVSINNLLGETYKSGGFEQARNANYPELKKDKQLAKPIFGSKYWYGSGTSYYLNLYVRF
jgi:hypothetical protein